jgi:hypothetical protein
MVMYVLLHSGTSSSMQPDIIFFSNFFILNININLCDDACEEKKSILRLNGEHWSMEKIVIFPAFSTKKWKIVQFH